ncbi:MAG: Cof-type HAD-IIB family hydrolase [Erysipelotrichaceae bacterium]|nr:Cof-type HAD-IIB family hydrolase [Erysipelotrichaceae bacterium]
MIKAVFIDVDGTLLSHRSKSVPESATKAIARLRENGVLAFISTGRHPIELALLPIDISGYDGYVYMNGQYNEYQGQIVSTYPIVGKQKEELLAAFANNKEYPIVIYEMKKHYTNIINDYLTIGQQMVNSPIPKIGKYAGGNVFQAVIYGPIGHEDKFKELLPSCDFTRWNDYGVDILTIKDGKGKGIRDILDYLNIDKSETLCIGDNDNDLEMFKACGIKVAMGNSIDPIKEIADYVTADVDDDGLAKALEHYGLI